MRSPFLALLSLAFAGAAPEDGRAVAHVENVDAGPPVNFGVLQFPSGTAVLTRSGPQSRCRQVKRARSSGRHDWRKRLARSRGR